MRLQFIVTDSSKMCNVPHFYNFFFLVCVLHRSTRPRSIMYLYGANNCTIVSPSMMTSAGTPCSAISPPQSSMADMAIRETAPRCPRLSTKSQCRPGRKAGAVRLLHTQENPIGSILIWKKSFFCRDFPKPGKRHWRGEYRFSKL